MSEDSIEVSLAILINYLKNEEDSQMVRDLAIVLIKIFLRQKCNGDPLGSLDLIYLALNSNLLPLYRPLLDLLSCMRKEVHVDTKPIIKTMLFSHNIVKTLIECITSQSYNWVEIPLLFCSSVNLSTCHKTLSSKQVFLHLTQLVILFRIVQQHNKEFDALIGVIHNCKYGQQGLVYEEKSLKVPLEIAGFPSLAQDFLRARKGDNPFHYIKQVLQVLIPSVLKDKWELLKYILTFNLPKWDSYSQTIKDMHLQKLIDPLHPTASTIQNFLQAASRTRQNKRIS